VSDVLRADLDAIGGLGGALAGHADAIGRIEVPVTITMPNSPLQALSVRVGEAVTAAFGGIGDEIRRLAATTETAAEGYAQADRAFAARLRRTMGGRG
jgi:hypothetical protein